MWLALVVVLAPLLALLVQGSTGIIDGQLRWQVVTPALTTVILASGTAMLACVWGVGAAWLVEACQFRGSRLCAFMLFLPFAMPPYLLAYVWADLVDDGGWLPVGVGVRNLAGACLVMSLALYPYVYLFARASFAQRSCGLLAAGRLLGCTPWGAFVRIALPAARPAIAIGALLTFMEAANDIAIAEDYGLRTLGHQVYDLWLNRDQQGTAAAVSMLLVLLAIVLSVGEATNRQRQRHYQLGVHCYCSDYSYRLHGVASWLALAWCAGLFLLAFAIPVAVLATKLVYSDTRVFASAWYALGDSLFLTVATVLLAFCLAGLLQALRKPGGGWFPQVVIRVALAGYAFPGVIFSLGAFSAAVAVADWFALATGWSLRWVWVSSSCLLLLALASRLLIIAWGALEAGMAQVSPRLQAVARNAGKGRLARLLFVQLPLMRPVLLAGILLLAVDVIKELPLTLVLRPFGMDTLALQVFQFASDEDLGNAAPAALAMVALTSLLLGLAYRWLVPSWIKPPQ